MRDAAYWTARLILGKAAERFEKMVAALGGPADLLTGFPRHLPNAPVVCEVGADELGTIVSMDTRALGQTLAELGGGRTHPTDVIDPAVGIDRCARIGDTVDRGSVLCRVHARTQADASTPANGFVRHLRSVCRLSSTCRSCARF